MLAKTFAPALIGVSGRVISIECDITNGLPGFVVVGLGDKAVAESRERVRSAIKNSGLKLPSRRITLNLAPADLPKDGSGYDLAMAVAVLAASGQLDPARIAGCLFLGELALNGDVRPVKGSFLAAELSASHSIREVFVPAGSTPVASESLDIFIVRNLGQLAAHLRGDEPLMGIRDTTFTRGTTPRTRVDLADIRGLSQAKRAVEIAAAGGHNLLLSGPPGIGKTMLARSLPSLLPPPSSEEILELTKLQNLFTPVNGFVTERPFRSPHHSSTRTTLLGGGSPPRPGELTMSHLGVLFLDEIAEYARSTLEVLRQPMEDGIVQINRPTGALSLPARFMLVATMNPCPCGRAGNPTANCQCRPHQIALYRSKLSLPILDRIDLHVSVVHDTQAALMDDGSAESSQVVAGRVAAARSLQIAREYCSGGRTNSDMSSVDLKKYCNLNYGIQRFGIDAVDRLGLSYRGWVRTLKVARTIADLEGASTIQTPHVAEALQYRDQSVGQALPV